MGLMAASRSIGVSVGRPGTVLRCSRADAAIEEVRIPRMSWFSDLVSGGAEEEAAATEPAERILQLRRGVSAAAAALPADRRETAESAVAAADELADRVAELVETPGPEEDVEVETPDEDVDAAGWLREGPARRREAGGPAGTEVADAEPLPDEIAREGAELMSDLHFALLRMEVLERDPEALSVEQTIERVRALADRLAERAGAGDPASDRRGPGGAGGDDG